MKHMLFLLAAVTAVGAGLVVVFTFVELWLSEGTMVWNLLKLLTGTMVVGVALLTWFWLNASPRNPVFEDLLLLGAMTLIAIGSASGVWTLHLAQVTGDFEAPILFLSGVMIVQGALTVWHLWRMKPHLMPG